MKILQKKIVGIDIHDYSAELVELSFSNKSVLLESFNTLPISNRIIVNGDIADEEGLKGVLQNLLKAANPKPVSTKNAVVTFPASKVLTHIFTLADGLSEKEIRKALPYEAEVIIPYSFDDIYWDFTVLRRDINDVKRPVKYVLFACITRDVADKYARILESAGLNPVAFGINAESLKMAISKQLAGDKTYLALDLGTLSVDYLILKNSTIQSYFSFNESGHKLISGLAESMNKNPDEIFQKREMEKFYPASSMDHVVEFIGRCYENARNVMQNYENGSCKGKIDGVVLTGGFLNLPGFYPLARQFFPDKEIIIGNPKKNLVVDEKKFHAWKENKGESGSRTPYAIYFTNAIGAVLNAFKGYGINLLPSRLKENIVKKRNLFLIALASILISAMSVSIATFFVLKFNDLDFLKKTLEIRKSGIQRVIFGTRYKEIYDHITGFNGEVNVISGIDKNLFSFKDVIGSIYGYIPAEIKITSWSFSDQDLSYMINGVADNRDALLKMQKDLGQSQYVSEVVAPISNYDKKNDISFEMVLKLDFNKLPRHVADA